MITEEQLRDPVLLNELTKGAAGPSREAAFGLHLQVSKICCSFLGDVVITVQAATLPNASRKNLALFDTKV
jgi:hypothetical protein